MEYSTGRSYSLHSSASTRVLYNRRDATYLKIGLSTGYWSTGVLELYLAHTDEMFIQKTLDYGRTPIQLHVLDDENTEIHNTGVL